MGVVLEGSRSTKPCVFPCKAAAASDERYLVCAAGVAGAVSSSNRFSLGVLQLQDWCHVLLPCA